MNPKCQKKLYAMVKSKRNDSSGVAPLRCSGTTDSDAKSKANLHNEQFVSVFPKQFHNNIDAGDYLEGKPLPDMDPIEISTAWVAKLLRNLQTHKATGPDGILAQLLKLTADKAAEALRLIFQA